MSDKPLPEQLNCETHGPYMSRVPEEEMLGIWWTDKSCAACKESEKAQKEIQDREEYEEKNERMLMSCGISKRNLRHTLKNLKHSNENQEHAIALLRQYASEFSRDAATNKTTKPARGLIIVGPVGTGKTLLASALVRNVALKGLGASLVKTIELVREVKSTWGKKPSDGTYHDTESDVMRHYSTTSLLVIDEIGVQFGSETEKMIIFDVIDQRYNNMLPTVIISNLNIDGVKDMLGDRTVDRLREDGGKLIVLDGPSNRK